MDLSSEYWNNRYKENETGWDIGEVSKPLKEYIDQLTDKSIKILIPGGGNSYEAEYLFNNGFKNVFVVDLATTPLRNLKQRIPEFPDDQLLHANFFDLNEKYDLVIEQTFFCAIDPDLRPKYAEHTSSLLAPKGRLIGVLFDDELYTEHPPFGGDAKEYESCFSPFLNIDRMERCYNSIKPRLGRELWINMTNK